MGTSEDVAREIHRLMHRTAKAIDEAPTGVKPGYSAALGGTVKANGRVSYVTGAPLGGLSAAAYINAFGGTSVPTVGNLRIQYDTVAYDPNSLITTGASWCYTVPTTGIYRLELHLEIITNGVNFSTSDGVRLKLYRGSISLSTIVLQRYVTAGEVSDTLVMSAVAPISLTAGWQLNVRLEPASMASASHQISGSGLMDFAIYRLT